MIILNLLLSASTVYTRYHQPWYETNIHSQFSHFVLKSLFFTKFLLLPVLPLQQMEWGWVRISIWTIQFIDRNFSSLYSKRFFYLFQRQIFTTSIMPLSQYENEMESDFTFIILLPQISGNYQIFFFYFLCLKL